MAKKYYLSGADELLIMDAVASLYNRNNLFEIIEEACLSVFIPVCLGGGIRSLDDIKRALDAGADKVAINTAAIKNIRIISDAAQIFGAQAIVGSIEAKRVGDDYLCYFDNGREPSSISVKNWVKSLIDAGAGEILVTSIDVEGTRRGFDKKLIELVEDIASVPVVWSGGAGSKIHLEEAKQVGARNFAFASAVHYDLFQPFENRNAGSLLGS